MNKHRVYYLQMRLSVYQVLTSLRQYSEWHNVFHFLCATLYKIVVVALLQAVASFLDIFTTDQQVAYVGITANV